jgi:peptidoglycan biosynthesis protein MviN/MurJ (putative lipid II flippase)
LLAATSIYKSSPLIDRFWTSQAPVGAVSIFGLAQTAMGACATVLDRAICVPSAPVLERLVDSGDFEGVRREYRRCVRRIALLAAPIPLVLLCLLPVWESLLHLTLHVGPAVASSLWVMCMLLTGYLLVGASGSIVVSAFYAVGDTRTPASVGTLGFFIGTALKSVAFVWFGVPGLAMATSLYYLLNMAAMCLLLERKINVRIS